jgi:hypothetical protein
MGVDMSRSDYSVDVDTRQTGHWASILQSGRSIWQLGPYPSAKEARSAARFRLAQHYSGSHRLPAIEQTPIGPQYVLPGAERITDSELARKRAENRLRPVKAQSPCDIGLFSDAAAQSDLVDRARR